MAAKAKKEAVASKEHEKDRGIDDDEVALQKLLYALLDGVIGIGGEVAGRVDA